MRPSCASLCQRWSRATLLLVLAPCLTSGVARAQQVTILHDGAVPQAAYAARRLSAALIERGCRVAPAPAGSDYLISLALRQETLGPEAFAIVPEGRTISVVGGDQRGLIYGALALAEALRNGTPLESI